MCFSYGTTGQAGTLSKFDLRQFIVGSRVDRCDGRCVCTFAGFWESACAMAAVHKKAWQAPRRSGNNR